MPRDCAMHHHVYAATDPGRLRETNEDKYFADPDLGLFIICDGMGGHAAGEVASREAIRFVVEHFRAHEQLIQAAHRSPDGYFRLLQLAESAVQHASEQLYRLASNQSDLAGMGTTLTLLLVVDDKGIMAHVGDTRLYLKRSGEVHLLTTDHTLAQELLLAGALSHDEAAVSSYQNVLTRSIGQQKAVQVDSLLFDLLPEDTMLLCSDGLSNYFEDNDEVTALIDDTEIEVLPRRLVELANLRGGRDNITAIVLQIDEQALPRAVDTDQVRKCLEVLKSVFLFRGLSLSRLLRVMNISTIQSFRAAERLIDRGERLEALYVVLDGTLQTTAAEGQGPHRELRRGQTFGASSLLHARPALCSVAARDSASVLRIPGPEFDRLTRAQPRLGRLLLHRLVRYLSDEFEQLRRKVRSAPAPSSGNR